MTDKEKELVKNFEARLRHLLFLYEELKKENRKLSDQLINEQKKNRELQTNYEEIESSYTSLKTASAISLQDGDIKKTKKRLSELVREVDNCIALLSE